MAQDPGGWSKHQTDALVGTYLARKPHRGILHFRSVGKIEDLDGPAAVIGRGRLFSSHHRHDVYGSWIAAHNGLEEV